MTTWGTAVKNKKTKRLVEVEVHQFWDEAMFVQGEDQRDMERGFKIVLVKIKEVK